MQSLSPHSTNKSPHFSPTISIHFYYFRWRWENSGRTFFFFLLHETYHSSALAHGFIYDDGVRNHRIEDTVCVWVKLCRKKFMTKQTKTFTHALKASTMASTHFCFVFDSSGCEVMLAKFIHTYFILIKDCYYYYYRYESCSCRTQTVKILKGSICVFGVNDV